MAISLKDKIEKIDGQVNLSVTFDSNKISDRRIARAVHKSEQSSGSNGKLYDMTFIFSRKGALKGAIDRLRERFGNKVKLDITAAA
jgi:hypothetical protein